MLQDAAGCRPLEKNFAPYSSQAIAMPMAFFAIAIGLYPTRPSKPRPWNVQHIQGRESDTAAVHRVRFILRSLVFVIKMAVFITVDGHAVWHQRLECHHLAFAVSNDLRIGISPQQ